MTLVEELHLSECTRFLPEVAESDLPALYRQAKVFVLPSHYEGFGFTVLEAMGCGTPAVVANRASLPEIAGEAALLVEPDDAEAMAEALYQSLTRQRPARPNAPERARTRGPIYVGPHRPGHA